VISSHEKLPSATVTSTTVSVGVEVALSEASVVAASSAASVEVASVVDASSVEVASVVDASWSTLFTATFCPLVAPWFFALTHAPTERTRMAVSTAVSSTMIRARARRESERNHRTDPRGPRGRAGRRPRRAEVPPRPEGAPLRRTLGRSTWAMLRDERLPEIVEAGA
jgi:hypothetical protein